MNSTEGPYSSYQAVATTKVLLDLTLDLLDYRSDNNTEKEHARVVKIS